jgi:PAS domain-containing protein
LINCLAAGLFMGLLALLGLRGPARRLRNPLLAFHVFVLLFIVGNAITLVSADMFWEEVGIAVLYSGSMPAAVACWLIALRYAEVQGEPFAWAGRWATRVPVALTALAWAVMITNPWHGRFLVPVIGAHNVHLALWHPLVWLGYALVSGSVVLLGLLAWRSPERSVRRNAALMGVGISVTLVANALSYVVPPVVHIDITVAGLCLTSLVFLYGAYRTRLFALLPIASREVLRHDPDALLLLTPDGRLLGSNPAALDLLGLGAPAPGTSAFALLAARLCEPDGSPLRPDALGWSARGSAGCAPGSGGSRDRTASLQPTRSASRT